MSDEKPRAPRSKVVRYKSNPFVEDMIITTKKAPIKLSRMGKGKEVVVNTDTGEQTGTHVMTYRKVDAAQFVKLFAANIAMTFDLKSSGIKAFNVLLWVVQNKSLNKDLVPMDSITLNEFLADHKNRKPLIKLSIATLNRGLTELENAQIIAKHMRQGWYYINPNFAFNGDRIAFTTLIERAEGASDDQLNLAGV